MKRGMVRTALTVFTLACIGTHADILVRPTNFGYGYGTTNWVSVSALLDVGSGHSMQVVPSLEKQSL